VPPKEKNDLFASNLLPVEYENENKLLSKIIMEEKYCNELCVPWEETLVIQLLGKKISYPIMLSRLKLLWKLHQGYDLRDVGHVYFMVKFDSLEDRWKVIVEVDILLFGSASQVSKWCSLMRVFF